ncbi:MAG: hypothetical protein HY548_00095 [Elusimicrobia bacterium]|nr:hypothetical protein [Elusimicrobiota bacterium]
MSKWATITLCLLSFVVLPSTLFAAGELDGTTWQIGEEGSKDADTLKFQTGQFTSEACIPYGFKTGPYQSRLDGDKITWTASQKNTKGEIMDWQGTVEASTMTGNYTHTKTNGKKSKTNWTAMMEQ